MRWRRQTDEDLAAVNSSCRRLHDAAANMQERMPTPDPELTQTLQAAISDYDAGTHFCMAGTQSLDPDELSQSVTFLKSANSRMNAAVAIVHRDLGTTRRLNRPITNATSTGMAKVPAAPVRSGRDHERLIWVLWYAYRCCNGPMNEIQGLHHNGSLPDQRLHLIVAEEIHARAKPARLGVAVQPHHSRRAPLSSRSTRSRRERRKSLNRRQRRGLPRRSSGFR